MPKWVPVPVQQLEVIEDPRGDVPSQVIRSLETARLRRMVRNLPPLERHVICWRYGLAGERLNHRQIARRLGVSVGTAYNLEQRGLEGLRDGYGIALRAA